MEAEVPAPPSVPRMDGLALSQILRRKRMERGAIDFDLPEPEVILNLQGETEEIDPGRAKPCSSDHRGIHDRANEAVAHFMMESGPPSIYRIHEPPQREAVDEFHRFVSHLGYKMRKESEIPPGNFRESFWRRREKPKKGWSTTSFFAP